MWFSDLTYPSPPQRNVIYGRPLKWSKISILCKFTLLLQQSLLKIIVTNYDWDSVSEDSSLSVVFFFIPVYRSIWTCFRIWIFWKIDSMKIDWKRKRFGMLILNNFKNILWNLGRFLQILKKSKKKKKRINVWINYGPVF